MQLAIDAGNSGIKFGLFENNKLVSNGKLPKGEPLKSVVSEKNYSRITTTISCSVLNELNIPDLPKANQRWFASANIA